MMCISFENSLYKQVRALESDINITYGHDGIFSLQKAFLQSRSISLVDMYIDNTESTEDVGQIQFSLEYDFQNTTLVLKIIQVSFRAFSATLACVASERQNVGEEFITMDYSCERREILLAVTWRLKSLANSMWICPSSICSASERNYDAWIFNRLTYVHEER